MRKKTKFKINLKSKYLIIIMTIVGISLMAATFSSKTFSGPIRNTVGFVVIPFQNGVNKIGGWLTSCSDGFKDVKELAKENEALKAKVDELTLRNQELVESQSQYERLKELYKVDQEYGQYNKIAAQIIAKDPGNWYSTFVIDKGSKDGLAVDMNVMADGGLVGIITEVGTNWSTVRSIIDDNSNVSAMIANTSDHCIVTGNLTLINSGKINFSQLAMKEGTVSEGDAVVTSNVSEKYQTGLLIGYVSDMTLDSNNLTTSGTIIPSVDFKHLREVLVITDLKQQREE